MYLNRVALITVNLGITCPFWASAFVKAADFEGTIAEVGAIGLPAPVFVAAMTVLVQAGGSISLITRLFAPLGAAVLVIFSLTASFLVHPFWTMPPDAFLPNFAAFTANMGLIGGLIAAAALTSLHKDRQS
ncbi:DoxX family protein [Pseudosulfitobacter sp. DSM 107133]|uniref:DoxX family protein n=1 Tax=Pseudosulfitobacter sp. DSM 107133 TaxID=2883100 RepID=UPI000DF3F3AC|nr:DoxX family protein [Pseudosulfitobacter sp. DSM 107133]UOA29769.1 Inner membrane protein YphA [Pseudosulfitobacter sp. DSM 107133]